MAHNYSADMRWKREYRRRALMWWTARGLPTLSSTNSVAVGREGISEYLLPLKPTTFARVGRPLANKPGSSTTLLSTYSWATRSPSAQNIRRLAGHLGSRQGARNREPIVTTAGGRVRREAHIRLAKVQDTNRPPETQIAQLAGLDGGRTPNSRHRHDVVQHCTEIPRRKLR